MDAYTFPVTNADVENTFVESATNPNPVMAVVVIGLTPIFPVILVPGVVEIPASERIAKLPAVPSFTEAGLAANARGTTAPKARIERMDGTERRKILFISNGNFMHIK